MTKFSFVYFSLERIGLARIVYFAQSIPASVFPGWTDLDEILHRGGPRRGEGSWGGGSTRYPPPQLRGA